MQPNALDSSSNRLFWCHSIAISYSSRLCHVDDFCERKVSHARDIATQRRIVQQSHYWLSNSNLKSLSCRSCLIDVLLIAFILSHALDSAHSPVYRWPARLRFTAVRLCAVESDEPVGRAFDRAGSHPGLQGSVCVRQYRVPHHSSHWYVRLHLCFSISYTCFFFSFYVLFTFLFCFFFTSYTVFGANLLGWVFWKTLASQMVIRQHKKQAQESLETAIRRMIDDKASMIISIEGYAGGRNEVE